MDSFDWFRYSFMGDSCLCVVGVVVGVWGIRVDWVGFTVCRGVRGVDFLDLED